MIIAIEGADQAGKATQARMLATALERHGLPTETFAFPDYATPVGRRIKASLRLAGSAAGTGRPASAPPQLLHLLLAANRWEALPRIRTALDAGRTVLMNRYYHSNMVYGLARGMRRGWLGSLDAGLPESDLVIVLDVDPSESFRRKSAGRDGFERDAELLGRVRSLYRAEARRDRRRWKVVDAHGPRRAVHARVLAAAAPAVRRLRGVRITPPAGASAATRARKT